MFSTHAPVNDFHYMPKRVQDFVVLEFDETHGRCSLRAADVGSDTEQANVRIQATAEDGSNKDLVFRVRGRPNLDRLMEIVHRRRHALEQLVEGQGKRQVSSRKLDDVSSYVELQSLGDFLQVLKSVGSPVGDTLYAMPTVDKDLDRVLSERMDALVRTFQSYIKPHDEVRVLLTSGDSHLTRIGLAAVNRALAPTFEPELQQVAANPQLPWHTRQLAAEMLPSRP